jgi:hypothetical protein
MSDTAVAVVSGKTGAFPAPSLRKITIGLHGGSSGYERALSHPGFRVGDDAYDALATLPYATAEQVVRWAVVVPAEVGLLRGGTYDAFIDAASIAGWELLMPEAAPAIRLQNRQRITARCLLVATAPIMLRDEAHLFSVCYDEDGWLRLGLPTHKPDLHYDADQPFAMQRVGLR